MLVLVNIDVILVDIPMNLVRQYEDKKTTILTYGPPHLRLESWFTPMMVAYERQLPIKVSANHTLSSL